MSAQPMAGPDRTGRRVTSIVVVVLLAIGIGAWWWREHRTGVHLTGVFTASVGIYPGSEVRILGVPVGAVDSVTPTGRHVRIAMHLDPGVNTTPDTDAVIISPNLVSDRYVQLTGVWTHGPRLQSGTVLPPSRTRTPVELDQLYTSLQQLTSALGPHGANHNGALSRVLDVGAANLKGNGRALNTTIRNLSAATGTLSGSRRGIFGTISNLSRFTRMLKSNNGALVTVNNDLASVTGTLASDRRSFGEALRTLASALSKVQRFIHDNRASLTRNTSRLVSVARTLADERSSLAQALESAPSLVDEFIRAYDPKHNLLRGRADLNEVTIWAKGGTSGQSESVLPLTATSATTGSTSSGSAISGSSSGSSPSLLPATNVDVCHSCGSGR